VIHIPRSSRIFINFSVSLYNRKLFDIFLPPTSLVPVVSYVDKNKTINNVIMTYERSELDGW